MVCKEDAVVCKESADPQESRTPKSVQGHVISIHQQSKVTLVVATELLGRFSCLFSGDLSFRSGDPSLCFGEEFGLTGSLFGLGSSVCHRSSPVGMLRRP